MNGVLVPLSSIPSQGYVYPKDLEIHVKPMSIKDQIDMDRYGISDSDYFKILLSGVEIVTESAFYKNDLIHFDVQFLDIVRRLYSFDVNEKITIEGCKCPYRDCGAEFSYQFKLSDLAFTDFNKDIFGREVILGEGTDDELKFTVSPLTTSEYTTMSREFRNYTNKRTMLSSMYTEYLCALIRNVDGREFKNKEDRDSFLKGYINNISNYKDKKKLEKVIEDSIVKLKPFKVVCEECGRETEVEVTPTSNFQQ